MAETKAKPKAADPKPKAKPKAADPKPKAKVDGGAKAPRRDHPQAIERRPSRKCRMVGHALTMAGAVRVIGEIFDIPDDLAVPSEQDQVRRWGEVKVVEMTVEEIDAAGYTGPAPAPAPQPPAGAEEAITLPPHTQRWANMSPQDMLEDVSRLGDADIATFVKWANSPEGTEEAKTIAKQFRAAI